MKNSQMNRTYYLGLHQSCLAFEGLETIKSCRTYQSRILTSNKQNLTAETANYAHMHHLIGAQMFLAILSACYWTCLPAQTSLRLGPVDHRGITVWSWPRDTNHARRMHDPIKLPWVINSTWHRKWNLSWLCYIEEIGQQRNRLYNYNQLNMHLREHPSPI